ncbi:PQQ-binding-like beta-propeller repeat protein [Microbulbifer rhizosphaerae]|uniref:Outer membrane protein assembly factor BamB n=1 Tax=Microbulbifer rhizosphaerae TaxID=1562603 RepID=A0A7W4WBD9_9GAMM|nr:PQQ-binding-like beta-propeller repeat protein [Microbulbifer rhizosphaerae]MBB3061130.1 outer membrane protein assembly factor BamB [Microbulbifer rhizosphaerae]
MQPRRLFRAHRIFLCVLGLIALIPSASATEYSLTGPQDFTRERGRPQRELIAFDAPAPGQYYLLRIHNGPGELEPVDSGWITVNHKKVANLAALRWKAGRYAAAFNCPFWQHHCRDGGNGDLAPVEIPLDLELANELSVELHGRPGRGLRLEVLSIGDENPYFNEFPLSGSHTFTPVFGWPQEQELTFEAPVAGAHYLLRLNNGAGDLHPVGAGWLWLNGRELLSPKDFGWGKAFCRKGHPGKGQHKNKHKNKNKHAPWRPDFGRSCEEETEIQLPLSLALENTLTVKLHGHWHSGVQLEIVGVDNDLPQIVAAVDPAANGAGWHNTDATVSFACSDSLSGIASCSDPVVVEEEGAEQLIEGTAVDKAGNSASTQLSVSLDKTPPQLLAEIDPPANDNGWHRESVTIGYTCADTLSGVASCPEAQQVSEEGADQQIAATAADIAGNTTEVQTTIQLDLTPPEIVTTITPPANPAGWHKTPVALSYQCSDNLSGVVDCPEDRVESQQGRNREIPASATDLAGNTAGSSALLSIDTTAPIIQTQLSSQANSNGWHNTPVTVTYHCSDSLSGIAGCSEPQTLVADGEGQVLSGSVVDLAGNTAGTEVTLNLDRTAPEIAFVSPADQSLLSDRQPELQLLLSDNLALDTGSLSVSADGTAVTACEIADNLAHCTLPAPLATDREVTLSASIKDLAGNSSEATVTTAIDSDGDTIADYADQCPATATTHTANADGCAPEQLDSDNDGISDAEEIAAGSDPEDANSFPPLSIETFAASPNTLESRGQTVELRWRVKGADTITLSNDAGSEAQADLESPGALQVSPQITTRYTLEASGPGGEATQSLTVTLDLPPPPDLWTTPTIPVKEQIATSLAVAEDGSAYVGAFDGNFYKVDPSGQVAWTLEDAGLVMGKVAITGDRIIVGANVSGSGRLESAGRVYALNSDKTLLWNFDTEGAVVAGPILSADKATAYIATYTGQVYALDAQNGQVHWKYSLPDVPAVAAAPALSADQGALIVHTTDRRLMAIDTRTAELGADDRLLWVRDLTLSPGP